MIRKEKDGYHVRSEKGKNLGGPYKSHEAAEERLAEVEKFKHMNKGDLKFVIIEKARPLQRK
jgi:hypothetical protein